MAATLGEIENECREAGISVQDSYAVLGEYDFLFVLDAPVIGCSKPH